MNTGRHIDAAIELLTAARRVAALTGAGISTPSGIPDFRSPDSGLWETLDDVLEVASIFAFRKRPQAFYDWIRPLAGIIATAEPNPAHLALATLERHGPLAGVITQNIDLLHSKAGSSTVYEVHGHMRELICVACHYIVPSQDRLARFLEYGELPACQRCHNIMKPNVVLFGELLPRQAMKAAEQLAQTCDVMIVAGSSLEVAPAGDLPALAHRSGARLIIVNYMPTHLDDLADVVIREDVAEVLPRLTAPFCG